MVDSVSPVVRSRIMSSVRGKNTRPELYVRQTLHAAGYRFRLHRKDLPGQPDIVLPRHRTVIFVHGCFWHGHDCKRGKRPLSNTAFWAEKIDGNIKRDKRNAEVLSQAGWYVVTIWQCCLETSTEKLIRDLAECYRFRVGSIELTR